MAQTFAVTATGVPTPSITEAGTLPTGVKFSGYALTGTPTKSGTFDIAFVANNGIGSGTVQDFTLTVQGLKITTTTLPKLTETEHYSNQLASTGGIKPLTWSEVGHTPERTHPLLVGTPVRHRGQERHGRHLHHQGPGDRLHQGQGPDGHGVAQAHHRAS